MTSFFRTGALLLVLFIFSSTRASAVGSITVAWDANLEPEVAGYIVHYGVKAGAYTAKVDVGKVLAWTVGGLTEGTTYYFAVQAYTIDGLVSPLSSSVSATIPGGTVPPPPPPQPIAQFTTVPGTDGRLTSRTLQWTTVSDAVAYYLYVGTAPGKKDIVDTGEIAQTSFMVKSVASEMVLYARLWTKQGTTWRFADMSFMLPASAAPSQFLAPLDGETGVSAARTFQWAPVPDATAYYLYVGTKPGAKDVVDTGETAATSWTPAAMPLARHLYARIWTRMDGGWYSRQIEFDTAAGAQFVNPADGASDVSAKEIFKWTAVGGARAYYLYVGTKPGAKDVVDSGEIFTTTYQASGLAPGQKLYARIWTSVGSAWVAISDITFKTGLTARLTQPLDMTDTGLPPVFKWTPVLGAQAYYLYVGAAPGAKDIIDSFETSALEYPTETLPARRMLYARMWTKLWGGWRFQDSAFRVTGGALTSVEDGGTVTSSHLFQWTAVANAEAYYLYVGDTPGTKNLVDTGEITQTYWPASLPVGKTLHATIWTKVAGGWTAVQSCFLVKP